LHRSGCGQIAQVNHCRTENTLADGIDNGHVSTHIGERRPLQKNKQLIVPAGVSNGVEDNPVARKLDPALRRKYSLVVRDVDIASHIADALNITEGTGNEFAMA